VAGSGTKPARYQTTDNSQRVERGLYVCEECGLVANADVNGAENIRREELPTLACDGVNSDTGWMAQLAVRLFDKSTRQVASQEQVTREPYSPNARETALSSDYARLLERPSVPLRSRRGGCYCDIMSSNRAPPSDPSVTDTVHP